MMMIFSYGNLKVAGSCLEKLILSLVLSGDSFRMQRKTLQQIFLQMLTNYAHKLCSQIASSFWRSWSKAPGF